MMQQDESLPISFKVTAAFGQLDAIGSGTVEVILGVVSIEYIEPGISSRHRWIGFQVFSGSYQTYVHPY